MSHELAAKYFKLKLEKEVKKNKGRGEKEEEEAIPADFESQMLLQVKVVATPSFEYQRSHNICALIYLYQQQNPMHGRQW